MKMLISLVGVFTIICIPGAFAQELSTNSVSETSPGATTVPFTPWGQRDGLYNSYSPMQNPPGSVQPSPLYSSPAGNPSGAQAPVANSSGSETEPLIESNTPETGRGPSVVQPASRVPSAPADGGTMSGATTGSSSLNEGDAIAPDGRKKK